MACVTDTPGEYRLYQDLAAWWPLISPPGEYVADAAVLGRVFAAAPSAVRTVLDLGSGGGHVAWHLKGRLELTLVDRSEEMLAVSRELNPDCEHVQGDMLAIRLGRLFDAVLVHDAIDYVTTEADLLQYVPKEPRYLEDPWEAILKHSLDARNFVEDVYRLDQRHAFEKTDDQEARELVSKRLAAGAEFLRDLTYTAWIDSAKPVPPVKPIDQPQNPDNPKYNPATGSSPAPNAAK